MRGRCAWLMAMFERMPPRAVGAANLQTFGESRLAGVTGRRRWHPCRVAPRARHGARAAPVMTVWVPGMLRAEEGDVVTAQAGGHGPDPNPLKPLPVEGPGAKG